MGFTKAHKMAQRLHRERRQPEHRKKLGYLEKKQDYKKRALDHHIKVKQLKKLKNKALSRNTNEFNFHMINSRMVDGVHQEILQSKDNSDAIKKEKLLAKYNRRITEKRDNKRQQEVINEALAKLR